MKGLAIFLATALALAGLFVLWQANRGPTDRARARARPSGPSAAVSPANETSAAVQTPRTLAPQDSERTPSGVRSGADRGTRQAAAVPAAGERKLIGAVLAEQGPLRGAQVLLLADGDPVSEADTDEKGRFEISFPVPAENVALRVMARGYAPFERALGNPRQAGQEFLGNLRVERGTILAGTVVDDTGSPLGGAEVGLALWSGDFDDQRVVERTRSGPDGRFRFSNAPSGRVVLTAQAEGWARQTVNHTHLPGAQARIELVRASTLRLRLRYPDGRPVVRARVTIQTTEFRSPPRQGESDEEGLLVFDDLAARNWTARVMLAGHKPAGLPTAVADGVEQVIEVIPWPCLAGRVLTPDKRPAPEGTRVVALPGGARGDTVRIGRGGTPVDAEGRFRICDLRPGQYAVQVSSPGFAATTSHSTQVGQTGDLDIGTLYLRAGGSLRLRLIARELPVSGVTVELHPTEPVPAQIFTKSAVSADAVTYRSDAEGRVRVENLTNGEVWVILRGEALVPRKAGPFTVADGHENEPAPIELTRGVRMNGRVIDERGSGVQRARIVVSGATSIPVQFSESDGSFTLPPLPPGRYRVHAITQLRGETRESPTVDVELSLDKAPSRVDLVYE